MNVGDIMPIFYVKRIDKRSRAMHAAQKQVTISGIFKTGIDDLDSTVAYSSLEFASSLHGTTNPSFISLAFSPSANEKKTIQALKEDLETPVSSWKARFAPLVAALILERYAMFLVIALITLVASMNIVALLFMQITNKRSEISILRTMGMSVNHVRRIFLSLGTIITALASATGIALASGASFLLQHYPLIKLPDVYYTSHLPAHLDWYVPPLVFCVSLIISMIATWIPSRRINTMNISQVLRFEG